MKCEICHKADAETAIRRGEGDDDELYVCKACAAADRKRRQKKSQRTHKVTGLPPGMSLSITEISAAGDSDAETETTEDAKTDGEATPPPIVSAFMDAMNGLVNDLERVSKKAKALKKRRDAEKRRDVSLKDVPPGLRLGNYLHLEGLYLINELEAVCRGVKALDMELAGIDCEEMHMVGHVYKLRYSDDGELAKRVLDDIIREELNARVRLVREMPRVFGDSICRALALLKNCRLLAPGECFDMLSPIRLAALDDLLDGITLKQVERLALSMDLSNANGDQTMEERDHACAELADEINCRFEDVILNEKAEGMYLA